MADAATVDGSQPDAMMDMSAPDMTAPDMTVPMGDIQTLDVNDGACYFIDADQLTDDNPCDGDLYLLTGFNVDLSCGGNDCFCLIGSENGWMPAEYGTLSDIPTDYAACQWTSYVEGIEGLTRVGLILRDRAGAHHYRFYIHDNTLPVLRYEIDQID